MTEFDPLDEAQVDLSFEARWLLRFLDHGQETLLATTQGARDAFERTVELVAREVTRALADEWDGGVRRLRLGLVPWWEDDGEVEQDPVEGIDVDLVVDSLDLLVSVVRRLSGTAERLREGYSGMLTPLLAVDTDCSVDSADDHF